jgi:hypothetical protein
LPESDKRGPEMLRRGLLALVTALIVARPLVLGEDPGLLNRLSSAWSLVLTLLWFVAAIGWAGWRAWSGERWNGSVVEFGLIGVSGLMWLSAGVAAHYKHPAFLVASEWVVLVIAFGLVRQLARTASDERELLAALVASAVSISAFALYQYTVEFPAIRQTYGGNMEALLEAMAAENVVANPELLQRRLLDDNVFGTYSHPNSLAGYLALLLPAAIGWTLQARGERKARWPISFFLAAAGSVLVGLALWLTHSRGAMLGSAFVGLAVLALYGRRSITARKTLLLSVLAVAVLTVLFLLPTGYLAYGITKFWESSAKRSDYWIATWSMIRDHPWFGVGPGNFGRLYPSYMLPRAYEQVKDPHNFLLEMWATGGLFALLVLLITLGLFFRRIWPVLRSPWKESESDSARPMSPEGIAHPGLRSALRAPRSTFWTGWEFYVGGMVGLVLGFVLRALNQSPEEVVLEGAYSACRSLVWFAAFALFYSMPWSGASLALALTAGVTALLINLLFSGGIALPSVAQPLWIVAALALNSLGTPVPNATRSPGLRRRVLPLAFLVGTGLAYFLLLSYPAITCGDALTQARGYYARWQAGAIAGRDLQTYILDPLEGAVHADPENAMAWLELAEWYGEFGKIVPKPGPIVRKALDCADRAHGLDPDNKDPFLFKHNLHVQLARRFGDREKEEYGQAAAAMRAAVQRDPTNARLRYQLVETLFLADLPVDGRRHARIAEELDEQSTRPERQLTTPQRERLRMWLTPK